jgi:biopolymer transport protein ExbD|tara:strand:- start:537 stop:896 length:360 start_codon:yes stop_codon:yes gene_type:complete
MIDVTFLLLIYFIATTVFIVPEDKLSPTLRIDEKSSTQLQDLDPQIVTVTMQESNPAYLIGERIIRDRTQLANVISKLPLSPGIIIRVEDNVPLGFAVAAVQESRDVGFEKVTYVPATD